MARPLILIHGFGGFAGLWKWQADYFESSRKVLAIDLPGHGARAWNNETLKSMALMIDDMCRREGIASADIAASSFGGLVAIKLCELRSDLVGKLVLAGSLPRFTSTEGFPAGLDPQRIRKLAGQFNGDVATVLDMFFRSVFTMKERESEHYARIKALRAQASAPVREALHGVLQMLEEQDLREVFVTLPQPVLFMFGDSDPICPLAVVEPLLKLSSRARAEVFKGIGHFPFLTMPDVFNRRVERFLQ